MELFVSKAFRYIECYTSSFLSVTPIMRLYLTNRKDMEQLKFLLEQIVSNYRLIDVRSSISPYAAYSAVGFHPEINAEMLERGRYIKCSNDEFERLVGYLSINFPKKIIWND